VELLYNWLDQNATEVQKQLDEPYLDGLVEVMETVFYEEAAEDLNDILKKKLQLALEELWGMNYTDEDMRKAIQLTILKGMRGKSQEQHLMTPESIGLIVGYLADKLMKKIKEIRLFDPAGG